MPALGYVAIFLHVSPPIMSLGGDALLDCERFHNKESLLFNGKEHFTRNCHCEERALRDIMPALGYVARAASSPDWGATPPKSKSDGSQSSSASGHCDMAEVWLE
ncbi:MAG: hypothetical protein WCK35_03995 [Chloroflexota bacterium]